MKTLPIGTAGAGEFSFTPPKQDYAIRLTRYAPGEKIRPEARVAADKTEGIAPLTIQFSTPWKLECHWDFGDGSNSTSKSPVHTFKKPGLYTVTLTVTDTDGVTGCTTLLISVDRDSRDPIIRFGFTDGDYPKVTLHGGKITSSDRNATEQALEELKKAVDSRNVEEIKTKTDMLLQASYRLAEYMYQEAEASGGAAAGSVPEPEAPLEDDGENVVDADFKEVD